MSEETMHEPSLMIPHDYFCCVSSNLLFGVIFKGRSSADMILKSLHSKICDILLKANS